MGFTYRKSVKLPGGVRVNFSNSGVGYSWGTKWHRTTKTAKGTIRETFTVPGTGISHVRESKARTSPASTASPNKSRPVKRRHGRLAWIVAIFILFAIVIFIAYSRSEAKKDGATGNIPGSIFETYYYHGDGDMAYGKCI